MNRWIYLLLSCFLCNSIIGQIKLPRLISDNMILQRDSKLTVWGWAAVGEKVNVRFNDKRYSTTTAGDSTWTITLPAMKAGGPYDMEISGSNTIMVKNILIGDV